MPHEKLDNLVKTRQLKVEDATPGEIAGLVRSGTARLNDSKNDSLSIESRFDLAYNAVHALSLAALRYHGYRSESRYLVFQCLQHTLDLPNEQWRVLDQAHRKRNIAEYEGEVDIDDSLIDAMIRAGEELTRRIDNLVKYNDADD